MRRTIIPTVAAALGTGIVVSGFAAILYHKVFFYQADGYMSPETAVRVGLMKDEKAPLSSGLAFKKSGAGSYAYREGRVTAFIGRTSHTRIDLVAECERLGGCQLQSEQESPHEPMDKSAGKTDVSKKPSGRAD